MSTARFVAVCFTAVAAMMAAPGALAEDPSKTPRGPAPNADRGAVMAEKGSDWSQFRGPNFDGSSPEKGLLREWPKEGPEILWRAKIKQGWSCPSVAGNDVIVSMSEFDPKDGGRPNTVVEEIVVCLAATNGQQKWKHSYPVKYDRNKVGWAGGGVRSTPAVTDKYVYTVDPILNIRCLNRATGTLVWEKAAKEFYFNRKVDQKGYTNSPIVANGVLLLHGFTGTEGKGEHFSWAMGLDAATGKQLWLNEDEEKNEVLRNPDGGATAVLVTLNQELCDLTVYNGYLRAFRVSNGKQIVKCNMFPKSAIMTGGMVTPLVAGNKVVVVPFGWFMACAELDFDKPERTKLLWSAPDYYGNGDYHSFVHQDGYLYGINAYDTDGNKVRESKLTLECLDLKDGKRIWKEPGFGHGYSYIIADGLMFLRSFQTLSLVELNPEKFILKSKMEKLHNTETITILDPRGLADCVMPVLARGKLYVRCPEELLCLRVAPK
jgi:outer membrane protein assembly factor BamB